MSKVNPFNNENCEIQARIIFEDWATVPMIRIVKLLGIYGDKIYNYRNIAIMIGCGVGTAHRSVAKLIQEKYLIESNGDLRLNQPYIKGVPKMEQKRTPVPPMELDVPIMEQSVPKMEPNSIREIIEENKEEQLSPDAPIKRSPNVILSDSQMERLAKKFGGLEEVDYWVHRLTAWQLDNPKKQKKDHARTIYNWRADKIAEGYRFYNHPETGWNYYKPWVIEKLKEAQQ